MVKQAIVAIVFAVAGVAGCGAAEADSDENLGTTAGALSEGQVADVLRNTKDSDGNPCFKDSDIGKLVCTSKYESGRNPCIDNAGTNSNGTTDYGLFQINSAHLGEKGCPSKASDLYNAVINAQCACNVYKSQGLGAWVAYKKNKSECDKASAPTDNCKTDDKELKLVCDSPDLTKDGASDGTCKKSSTR